MRHPRREFGVHEDVDKYDASQVLGKREEEVAEQGGSCIPKPQVIFSPLWAIGSSGKLLV